MRFLPAADIFRGPRLPVVLARAVLVFFAPVVVDSALPVDAASAPDALSLPAFEPLL
jgi:hypothetical protein